jgi:hypothetical protein
MRALTIAQWHAITKAGGGGKQKCNILPMMGAAKGGQRLVLRSVKGSDQQLEAKAAGNESVDGRTIAYDDESRWQTMTQQPTNNVSSKRRAGAGKKTA